VELELGQPLDEIFAEFDREPIASGSIGQVHAARLNNGERVVVKVQHTGIERVIRQDLDVLAGLAQLAERFEEFKPYRPKLVVAEMSRTLRREVDFGREERNLSQFAAQFANNESVRIPLALTEYCTSRVLTMEMIEGVKLESTSQLAAFGIELDQVAKRGVALYFDMIFKYGFYHADPHPGNIVLLPGNVIGLLDFGMVGRVNERLREQVEDMLLAIVNQDAQMLASIVQRIGTLPPEFDDSVLINDLADFVGHYSAQTLEQIDMGEVLTEMMGIVRRHYILLPAEAALLIKTLITLEGTARLLSPKFSLAEALKPFHRTMLRRRLSPMRQIRKLRRLYLEVENLVEVLPQRLGNILEQIQSGKFDVHLDHRRLGPSVNRLVLGMMTSALFLGSSFLLSYKVPPFVFPEKTYFGGMHQLSVLGLAGCIMSILIGLRLFLAIRKSGNLDRKDE
jgi:ubiquinone biosynthesis protein